MIRLVSGALIALSLPAASWAKPPATDRQSQHIGVAYLPPVAPGSGFARGKSIGRTEIAPNLHFGFGVFGLKSEKSPMRPVTAREIDAPKQRRAAVGFSLKF